MYELMQFGVVITLLTGFGLLLILRSKSPKSKVSLQWLGYALIIMVLLLVAVWVISLDATHVA
ncbi:hypothetical protein [Paenibacillus sp. MBLB4367]|uniref:hypothetical protein n=1 Tax=Paenibacillus sp. MBLB4367 TaxID=3384767 RepID=UPI003907F0AC